MSKGARNVIIVLVILAVVAEELSVTFSRRMTLAASNLPVLLAIMLLGLWPALLVAGVVGLWGFWREDSADIVLFNAAGALIVAGKVSDLKAGVEMAADAIDKGAARTVLENLIKVTNQRPPM